MAIETRPAISLEYLRLPVGTTDEDGLPVDPTGDVVQLAFVLEGEPITAGATFLNATWVTDDSDPTMPIYYARLLIGPFPGSYIPVAGTTVDVYVRITDNPEMPVVKSGVVRFT